MPKGIYHCHSHWSDGQNSISEMVFRAADLGFEEIGISDHLVIHPDHAIINWSILPEMVKSYVHEIEEIRASAPIKVRAALEVDFFQENPRLYELGDIFEEFKFDYIIGSVHMIDMFPLDSSPSDWEILSQKEIDQKWHEYWQVMLELASSPIFNIIGHLDLPKKFGFKPSFNIRAEARKVLDKIKKTGKIVELNTAGWDKTCRECYPSRGLLYECHDREIPIIVTDDSHATNQIGRHFSAATQLLDEIGIVPLEKLPEFPRPRLSF